MRSTALATLAALLVSSVVLAGDVDNPQTNASQLTTGTLAAARGGTGVSNSANLTVSTATSVGRGQYQATNTNDAATAGNIGDYTSGSTAATALSTTVSANIHTLTSLPAGDWDVQCVAKFNPAATTTIQDLVAEVSLNNAPALDVTIGNYTRVSDVNYTTSIRPKVFSTPVVRISLASASNVYCHGYAEFAVSTMTADGFMRARRPR